MRARSSEGSRVYVVIIPGEALLTGGYNTLYGLELNLHAVCYPHHEVGGSQHLWLQTESQAPVLCIVINAQPLFGDVFCCYTA